MAEQFRMTQEETTEQKRVGKGLSSDACLLPAKQYDVIIVGSGIAGLSFAIKSAEAGQRVAIITKKNSAESNTNYAQGGLRQSPRKRMTWRCTSRTRWMPAMVFVMRRQCVRFFRMGRPVSTNW